MQLVLRHDNTLPESQLCGHMIQENIRGKGR